MLSFIHGHDIAYIHRDILPKYLKSYGWLCDSPLLCKRADIGIISFSFSDISASENTHTFISYWLHAFTSLDIAMSGMHGDLGKCGFTRSPDSLEVIKDLDDIYQFDFAVDSLGDKINTGHFSMCKTKFMENRKVRAKLRLWEEYWIRYKDKHFKLACPGEAFASPGLLYFYMSHLKGGQGLRFFPPLTPLWRDNFGENSSIHSISLFYKTPCTHVTVAFHWNKFD